MKKLLFLLLLLASAALIVAWWSGVLEVKNTESTTVVKFNKDKARDTVDNVVESGKQAVQAGKKAVESGKEAVESGKKAVEAVEKITGKADGAGSIKGIVLFDGTPPPPRMIPVPPDNQKGLGVKEVLDETLVVDKDSKAIKYAVIRLMITPKDEAPKPAHPPVLDQKGGTFVPHVVVVPPEFKLHVYNHDGEMHNIHTRPQDFISTELNSAQLPGPEPKVLKAPHISDPEIITVECNVHAWMRGVIVVHDPRYCAVTAEDGKFEIKSVPPGKYKLKIFQEKCGEKEIEVTVNPGAESDVGEIKLKKGKY